MQNFEMNEANYNIRVSDTVESRTYKGRTISWVVYSITGKDFMRILQPTIDLFKMNNKGLNWANDDEKISIFVYPGTRIVVNFWDRKYIPEFVALIAKERVMPKVKKMVPIFGQEESRLSRILERANPNAKYFFAPDLSEAFCQTILLHEDIVTKSSDFIRDSAIPGVKVFREVWNTDGYPENCPDATLTVYRNEAGDMVCTEDESGLIKFFTKHGIGPVKSKSGHSVCSIGFSEKEQKWYGWSHRAMCGFGSGDKIFEQKFSTEDTLFTKHGAVTIENMAQARAAAVAFANYVS